MGLTGAQIVTAAEITYETYERIAELALSLNADQENEIIANIEIWNAKKNKRAIRLEGNVNRNVDRLLDDITIRVRNAFGLSLRPSRLCPASRPFAGGLSQPSGFKVGTHHDY